MTDTVRGRLVLDDRVATGRITIEDGADPRRARSTAGTRRGRPVHRPRLRRRPCPRLGRPRRDGRSRGARRHGPRPAAPGVTSFLPTAVTAPLDDLAAFADAGPRLAAGRARATAPSRSGSTSKGPFLAAARRGAHDAGASARRPADVAPADLEPLARRPPAADGRPRAARRDRPDRLAPRARRGGVARPLGGDVDAGAGRLRGRRALDDPPVQRDDRRRPPRAGRRRRRAARRRRPTSS